MGNRFTGMERMKDRKKGRNECKFGVQSRHNQKWLVCVCMTDRVGLKNYRIKYDILAWFRYQTKTGL